MRGTAGPAALLLGLSLAMTGAASAQSPAERAAAAAEAEAATKLAEAKSAAAADPAHDAMQAWQAAYARALDTHLRERAAHAGPRERLAAALLWPAVHAAATPADPAAPRPDGDWFRAAANAKPRDPLVAWREAAGCQPYWPGCDPEGALAWLLEAAPDDMTVQLAALNAAQARGDADAAAKHLHAAAQAPRRSSPLLDIGGLFVAATAGVQAPPLDAQVAAALGRMGQFNRPATATDYAGLIAVAVWAAQAMPGYQPLVRMCGTEADMPATRRDDCVRVMDRLADSPVLIEAMLGAVRSVRLAGDGEAAARARDRLRRLTWVQEHAQGLLSGAGGAPLPADYLQRLLEQGDLPALQAALQANGIAAAPPADWLPENPNMRELLSPAPKVAPAAPGG